MNATDGTSGMDYVLWTVLEKPGIDGRLVSQVKFFPIGGKDRGETVCQQMTDYGRSDQASMSRDEDGSITIHFFAHGIPLIAQREPMALDERISQYSFEIGPARVQRTHSPVNISCSVAKGCSISLIVQEISKLADQ